MEQLSAATAEEGLGHRGAQSLCVLLRTHPHLGSLLTTCIVWLHVVHGKSHEGKAEDPGESSQAPTGPFALSVLLTYWEPKLHPGQGLQLAELGSKPHLVEMEKKNCHPLFL